MKAAAALLLLFISVSAFAAETPAAATETKTFGGARTLTGDALTLSSALGTAKPGAPVLVTATAEQVCVKKGCWMVLKDGETSVRVTFKDYGFFVPKEIVGKSVTVEGLLEEKVVTEKEQRHYASDAGKSKAEVKAIKGDLRTWSMVATSVTIN